MFFLDEIQTVPGWEAFVRRVMDTERVEIFLSGSSARLLSREVATQMRGRAMETLVLPFSFREYLRHAGAEPETMADRWTKSLRSAVEKRLRAYLATGGFPEAQGVTARDRLELLRGYVNTALFRDVVERHAVSNPVALRWMVRHLLGNAAGTFSVQRFYGDLRSQGIPVAKDTLHAYVGHLEDAFLIRTLPIAADSGRRRMVNPRKVYPVDPGLIPVFDRAGRDNTGHALETVWPWNSSGAARRRPTCGREKASKSISSHAFRTAASNSSRSARTSTRPTRAIGKRAACWPPQSNTRGPRCTWWPWTPRAGRRCPMAFTCIRLQSGDD